MARVYYIYLYMCVCVFSIYYTVDRTKTIITGFRKTFGRHVFSLSTFCRRLHIVFARINSPVTSINHSSHTYKKRLSRAAAKDDKKYGPFAARFFPPVPPAAPRPNRSRRFVYFIINTNIANTSSVRLSDLHHLYRCQNIRSRMGRKRK